MLQPPGKHAVGAATRSALKNMPTPAVHDYASSVLWTSQFLHAPPVRGAHNGLERPPFALSRVTI